MRLPKYNNAVAIRGGNICALPAGKLKKNPIRHRICQPNPVIDFDPDKITAKAVGERIKRLRTDLGWNYENLRFAADLCIGGHSIIIYAERGRTIPNSLNLYKIACALGVTMEYLLTGKQDEGS